MYLYGAMFIERFRVNAIINKTGKFEMSLFWHQEMTL